MRRVVILGAGPVGLTMANKLSEQLSVLVVSPSNPIKFRSAPDSDFVLHPSSESGTLFGNSVHWGSQHESLDIPSASAPEFSDLPGFPFDLNDLNEYEQELLIQGWPSISCKSAAAPPPISRDKIDHHLKFETLGRTLVFQGKSPSPLPEGIRRGVTSIKSDFRRISFSFNSDLSIKSIELDGVAYSAEYFVLALGGLSNVAFLQLMQKNLHGLGDVKLAMLGKGYSNHPKAAVMQIDFTKFVRLNRGDFLSKYKIRANYELDLSRNGIRGLRMSARLWPQHVHSSFVKSVWFRVIGKFGFFKRAKVVVYFELPQRSANSISLLSGNESEFVFKFEYQFPLEMKAQVSKQLELLINSFLTDKKVRNVKRLLVDFDEVLYLDSNHHFGGTRMADNCAEGVVDGVGRTFLSSNLFVVGTSTLPVSSSLHPTLLCAALSLRTAAVIAKL